MLFRDILLFRVEPVFRRLCYRCVSHRPQRTRTIPQDGLGLEHFMLKPAESPSLSDIQPSTELLSSSSQRKVFFEIHGCQMNNSDGEVCWSILKSAGYQKTDDLSQANVVLILTCAIRDSAEEKIWKRLDSFKKLNRFRTCSRTLPPFKVGLLGCMAERLKEKVLEKEKLVDLVVGPDGYRSLPSLLETVSSGQTAVNVLLSKEETYADIAPVHLTDSPRGCDNFCSFCIVPFVRGKERSRPVSFILDDIRLLSEKGVKEVTLLGQNVNSYRDLSDSTVAMSTSSTIPGFREIYKPKTGGITFCDLLDQVSRVDPEMRIRFQSPHPKDFPLEVLQLIRDRPNVCNQIHLPAQSGSTSVLKLMRRGYSRETYLTLVKKIKEVIPDVSLTSDMIAGFCGESDEDHEQTLDLIRKVGYSFVYCYPYSTRENTSAHKRYADDVPLNVKKERADEIQRTFREVAAKVNSGKIGSHQLVLIEKDSKRSSADLEGRVDGGTKVIFAKPTVGTDASLTPGDYVEVMIESASSQVLHGKFLQKSSVAQFHSNSCDTTHGSF